MQIPKPDIGDTVPFGYVLQVVTTCPACSGDVPVNGLATSATCGGCGAARALPETAWAAHFSEGIRRAVLAFPEGAITALATEASPFRTFAVGRDRPTCLACDGPALPLDRFGDGMTGGGLPCDACGARIPMRPADDLARALHPGARWVVGESHATGTGPVSVSHVFHLICDVDRRSVISDADARRDHVRLAELAAEDEPAGRTDLSGDDCRVLAIHGTAADRERLAENPATPPEVVGRLLDLGVEPWYVARHPNAPADALARIAGSEEVLARRGAAAHPSTPPEVLERLAEDADAAVRRTVAEHPATGPEVLSTLARDTDELVRRRAAANPGTPSDALRTLARDRRDRWALVKARAELARRGDRRFRLAKAGRLLAFAALVATAAALTLRVCT